MSQTNPQGKGEGDAHEFSKKVKKQMKKNDYNWEITKFDGGTMIAKPVDTPIGDGGDWDIDLDNRNPQDLEVYSKLLLFVKCGRAEEGWRFLYDYAVKTNRINRG